MSSDIHAVVTVSIMVINILILVCYALFLCCLKKIQQSTDKMKNIYRSLIVVSLTSIFGWFSTTLIGFLARVFNLNISRADTDLIAGIFVNTACAVNFFAYYGVR
ncbi:hypothetical protein COOONC_23343 [Cooperia oncophora]